MESHVSVPIIEETSFDLIVVGLGISGLCIAFEASLKGYKVLGLEKNRISGDFLTATHGGTRNWNFAPEEHDDTSITESIKRYYQI